MPKSSKKKKDKAADFTKARLKLGKGKQQPSNVIDTSFKARSIALPTQSIAVEKDASLPLTKRHLSFVDLISHLRHHNASVRKDAILGFKELFEAHWDLLDSNMPAFIGAIIRLIGDEDSDVRKTLLTFFQWCIPRIPTENLIPHSHLLLLYTTSAQTHIFPEIRIDAVRFLDVFLEKMPEVLVEGLDHSVKGHGHRILEGYLGLLNAGTKYGGNEGPAQATSTASVTLTPASKYVVLNSLSIFLQHALRSADKQTAEPGSSTRTSPAWYLENAFQDRDSFLQFEKNLLPWRTAPNTTSIRQCWNEIVEDDDPDDDFLPSVSVLTGISSEQNWNVQDIADVVGNSASQSLDAGESSFSLNLARTLHSTLVAIFLDNAPAAFTPSGTPTETEMGMVLAVVRLVLTIYQSITRASKKSSEVPMGDLEALLSFMAPYFPAESSSSKNMKLVQFVDSYNLLYCELVSLLLIAQTTESSRASRKPKAAPSAVARRHLRKFWEAGGVGEFIQLKLEGRSGSSGIATPIGPAVYLDFLPTIWAFITKFASSDDGGSNTILLAALNHAIKTSSKSASKRLTIEFVSRLALLDTIPQYQGDFVTGKSATDDQGFKDWIVHLPQVLWELGHTNLLCTETIILALLRLLQSPSRIMDPETVTHLHARMTPYFRINHPVRGPLAGPFTKLPLQATLRRLVLDMVSVLLTRGRRLASVGKAGLGSSLDAAVKQAVEGTPEEVYWGHVGNRLS
ncbi:hypothetical protein BKA70DRAFT_1418067 [Coprinopsis sp. MPI-PUGE-AT-0042]|nr:hypothetical protein BKA70DRAFT_1418067 [Coprinopsis sp. MPI-PUGE-AT-0042]